MARLELGDVKDWVYFAIRGQIELKSYITNLAQQGKRAIKPLREFVSALSMERGLPVGSELHINQITRFESVRGTVLVSVKLHIVLCFAQLLFQIL
jgi:hypothetical protein